MDVFALVMWVLVGGIAVPVGLLGLRHLPLFVLQAMAGGGAATAWVLFIILGDEPRWLAWVSMGFWLVAVASLSAGVIALLDEESSVIHEHGEAFDEMGAGLAGVELPLLVLTGVIAIWPALRIGLVA
jgi:hypothetical protein